MIMDLPVSKNQMELAIKILERRATQIGNVALFRGIPATAFDEEHLVMLCNLFAEDLHKAQAKYFRALD